MATSVESGGGPDVGLLDDMVPCRLQWLYQTGTTLARTEGQGGVTKLQTDRTCAS